MKKLALTGLLGAAGLALAACGETDGGGNESVSATGDANAPAASGETRTATVVFPRGARIVEEDGVTFRIDPDGTRVRLAPGDSRIVIEDDVRFRVDPDGSRVRIGPDGAEIDIDIDGPSLEVNTTGR